VSVVYGVAAGAVCVFSCVTAWNCVLRPVVDSNIICTVVDLKMAQ